MSKIKICLDPGHKENYNTGVISSYREGTAMYKLAYYMKDYLEATGIFEVFITRTKIQDCPSLDERAVFAGKNNCSILLSLHTNAFSNEKAIGTSMYHSVKRPNSEAFGDQFAQGIANFIKKYTGVTYSRGCATYKNDYGNDYYGIIRSAVNYSCLKYIYLIEHCFHTNTKECTFLNSDANLKALAQEESNMLYNKFKSEVTPDPVPTPTPIRGQKYEVYNQIKGYRTADDAMKNTNPSSTINTGIYYVYRDYKNGALNITSNTSGGTPGAWINPATNIKPVAPPKPPEKTPEQKEAELDVSKLHNIMITNTNKPEVTYEQAVKFIKSNNPNPMLTTTVEDLAMSFICAGEMENVRWDVMIAQSCIETGFFKYGGQVKYTQNNFAGIGATNGGAAGGSFASPLQGALAQAQHLKAYATKDATVLPCVDPRFHLVTRGWAPYVEWLGMNENPKNKIWNKTLGWAVPGDAYGKHILDMLSRLITTK